MKKSIFLLIVLYISFALACSDQTTKQEAENKTDKSNEQASSNQPQENRTDREIKFYQGKVKRDPGNYSSYTSLGEAYIQKARETGDTDYYDKAEEVLEKAFELYPASYAAAVFLGQVSSAKHEFQDTLTYAKKAIELKPQDSYAYGILGDAYAELGEYEKAEKAFDRMLSLKPDLYSYSRISYIKELNGDTKGAIEAMQKSIEEGVRQNLPAENIAWAHFILGDAYFNAGDLKNAEAHYKESLDAFGNYHYALAGLARIKAAEGDYRESVKLYSEAIGIIPLPAFVSSLGDVYKKTGNKEEAKKQYDLVEYIGLLSKVNKVVYNRELAVFYADHNVKLDEALRLAEKELEAKKDIYTYDTLAWALYKNNKLEEALNASKESLRLGTKDAKLFFHSGMIYYKLGEMDKAKEYLKEALSINPHFHIIYSESAENALKQIEIVSNQ